MSHNVGGISKLRTEQQKIQEQHEHEQYKRFLAQFTMENFLEKVTTIRVDNILEWHKKVPTAMDISCLPRAYLPSRRGLIGSLSAASMSFSQL